MTNDEQTKILDVLWDDCLSLGRMADAGIISIPANQRMYGYHQAIRDDDSLCPN